MKAATHPEQERRLAALRRYQILDTDREKAFDDVVALVSAICEAPIAVVNFIDADRQWFKAEVGLGVRSTPLDTSLCSHVILEDSFVEIPDTLLDPRMRDNPLCAGEKGLRFYAGATLRTDDGLPLGTLCVLDNKPRRLTDVQRHAVSVLADQVMRQLDLRNALRNQEVLRREADHRVKNSLASVIALVTLQANRSDDDRVKAALGEVQQRLAALVSLHQELHQSGDGERIDLRRFVERLAALLRPLLPEHVAIETAIDEVMVGSSSASSMGILINEFVANSAKHAFPGGRRGVIRIVVHEAGGRLTLELSDNGVGDEATAANITRATGLGNRIMAATIRSLGGMSHWSSGEPGLRLTLSFKDLG